MPEIDQAALAAYLVLPTTLAGAVGFLLGVLVKWIADLEMNLDEAPERRRSAPPPPR